MEQNSSRSLIGQSSTPPSRLRALVAAGQCIAVPETQDGLMARMVAQAGFEVAFVGLMGSALNRIGSPDAGLLTATELVDNAQRCMDVSGLATVVDIGSGFGNPINVRRTVAELARAGAAAVLLRDAADPRLHRSAHEAIPAADMVAKLKAATDVRGDAPWVLLAGIEDASAGLAPAVIAARAARYRAAGADLIYLGSLSSLERASTLAAALPDTPLACSLSPDSALDVAQLAALGFRLAFFPHCGLMAAIPAIEHTFAELARTGSVGHLRPHIADFRQFTDIAGLPQVQLLEERYGVPDEQRTVL